MRKNRLMRLASVLLICVLLTISVIGGTFAKYITLVTAEGEARVAKWGVTFAAGTDLFATAYKDTAVTDNTATVKVTTGDTSKLVAPGTAGTALDVTILGDSKPEVSYSMTIELADDSKMPKLTYTPTTGDPGIYEPVRFKVHNGTTLLGTKSFSELKALFGDTKTIYTYDVATQQYTVDTDLDGSLTDETPSSTKPAIKIEWEWAIDTGVDDTKKTFNSKLDTILGDLAAGIDTQAGYKFPDGIVSVDTTTDGATVYSDVKLDWTMTATQID